jgi:hypothetical protein
MATRRLRSAILNPVALPHSRALPASALHADLTMLARLSLALSRAQEMVLAAV